MTELNIIRGSETIRQLRLFCVVRQSHPHILDQDLLDWAALRHGQEDERVGESKRMRQVCKRRETVSGRGAHRDEKPTGMGVSLSEFPTEASSLWKALVVASNCCHILKHCDGAQCSHS